MKKVPNIKAKRSNCPKLFKTVIQNRIQTLVGIDNLSADLEQVWKLPDGQEFLTVCAMNIISNPIKEELFNAND